MTVRPTPVMHGGGGKGALLRSCIVSDAVFRQNRSVERHRLVHDALAALLETDIHALALSTKTPDELVLSKSCVTSMSVNMNIYRIRCATGHARPAGGLRAEG